MVKFMIVFNTPRDPQGFEDLYNAFLALVEQMPDVIRRQVISVLGSPRGEAPVYRILEVYFEDTARMDASLRSPSGQTAGAYLGQFPPGTFDLWFAEVFEEAGGSTPLSTGSQPTTAE
jgi:uncharacterized protein (TIGR02118 family)